MKKISIVESIISFQEWIALKFLNRSLLYKPLSTIIKRSKEKFSPNSTSHFTIPKIAKGFIGFIPIGVLSYYLGYTTANKIDFNTFIKYLRSEDEIYSLLDQGKPVLTFMFLPGEVFSETTHIHFHKIAHENYQ